MPWTPNLRLGTDTPVWDWLAMFPGGNANPGTANCWDGTRYMYWLVQTGTGTAGSASTTVLYRYDTWTDAWQFLATATSGNQGMDLEYDGIRNVVYICTGNGATSWQVFNLGTTSVTISNTVCAAWALTTMAPVLPAAAATSSSFTMPQDLDVPATFATSTLTTGTTSTVLNDTAGANFGQGMVGMQVRLTSGTYSGQIRVIVSVQSNTQLTVSTAFGGTPAPGDGYIIEQIGSTATAGAVGTLTDANMNWAVNQYANMDVVINSGTGSGQRRRIASNTATVLTLAGTTTGNPRTGNFGVAPDATSVYKIIPSSDFLYFQPGTTSAVLYKIDVNTGANAATWTTLTSAPVTPGGGANSMFPRDWPYTLLLLRGGATGTYYIYDIGLNTWRTPTVFVGSETFTTGATAAMLQNHRRMFLQKEGSTRLYVLNLMTGVLEPFGTMPYANPTANDGHRARYVKTADGVEWLYIMRAGGAEFFRVALEWLVGTGA